jgi:hypothetical protein
LSILGDINGPNQLLVSVLFYFSSFVSILGHINGPNQLSVSILVVEGCDEEDWMGGRGQKG